MIPFAILPRKSSLPTCPDAVSAAANAPAALGPKDAVCLHEDASFAATPSWSTVQNARTMRWLACGLAALGGWLATVGDAHAQPPGGGFPGGGFPGGGGPPPGMGFGGGPPMMMMGGDGGRGGRGGGGWGGGGFGGPPGGGGFDPSQFITRMDTNGNGSIDPEEAQGPARFMLDRMARNNPKIDLSKPIPISAITEAFQQMRNGGSPGGGPGGDMNDESVDAGPSTLVPTFGIKIDKLTAEQRKYLASWEMGT